MTLIDRTSEISNPPGSIYNEPDFVAEIYLDENKLYAIKAGNLPPEIDSALECKQYICGGKIKYMFIE